MSEFDTVTLRHLTEAVDDLYRARTTTDNGLVVDYCTNAIDSIVSAITMILGAADES